MSLAELLAIVGTLGFGIAVLATLAAGFIRGFVGMGSGMLMAPVFAMLFGPLETVVMIIVLELAVSFQLLPSSFRKIEWPLVSPMFFGAIFFLPIGTWILVVVDAEVMSRLISAVVLLFVILLAMGWRYRRERNGAVTVGVGAVSGTLMGATSLGGPPVMLYLLSGPDSAEQNRANFIGFFALCLILLVGLLLYQGLLVESALIRALVVLPAFITGTWLGSLRFRHSGDTAYRQITLVVLACVALIGLLR